jgi:hypothetical protein
MKRADIKRWIAYWTAAKAVAFNEIHSVADMSAARKFCAVMRDGVFWNVTDGEMWAALREMRA